MDYYQNVDDNFGNPRTELQQILHNIKLYKREFYFQWNPICQFLWFYQKQKRICTEDKVDVPNGCVF